MHLDNEKLNLHSFSFRNDSKVTLMDDLGPQKKITNDHVVMTSNKSKSQSFANG